MAKLLGPDFISLQVRNLSTSRAFYTELLAKGATIIQPPYDWPFGRTFVFADPDGYRITAKENPWDRFPLGGGHQR